MTIELPLFPLHSVLFPTITMPLHIFEERYRLMIQRCLDEDHQFGVVLIADGEEVGEVAVPHQVGTIARIVNVDRQDDGRMELSARGGERFRLNEWWEVDGYLQGSLEIFDDDPDETQELVRLALRAHALFDRYITLLTTEEDLNLLLRALPHDPKRLSFVISAAMPISSSGKQGLLELASSSERLTRLCRVLQDQIRVRQVIQRARDRAPSEDQMIGGFFSNN